MKSYFLIPTVIVVILNLNLYLFVQQIPIFGVLIFQIGHCLVYLGVPTLMPLWEFMSIQLINTLLNEISLLKSVLDIDYNFCLAMWCSISLKLINSWLSLTFAGHSSVILFFNSSIFLWFALSISCISVCLFFRYSWIILFQFLSHYSVFVLNYCSKSYCSLSYRYFEALMKSSSHFLFWMIPFSLNLSASTYSPLASYSNICSWMFPKSYLNSWGDNTLDSIILFILIINSSYSQNNEPNSSPCKSKLFIEDLLKHVSIWNGVRYIINKHNK